MRLALTALALLAVLLLAAGCWWTFESARTLSTRTLVLSAVVWFAVLGAIELSGGRR